MKGNLYMEKISSTQRFGSSMTQLKSNWSRERLGKEKEQVLGSSRQSRKQLLSRDITGAHRTLFAPFLKFPPRATFN